MAVMIAANEIFQFADFGLLVFVSPFFEFDTLDLLLPVSGEVATIRNDRPAKKF